MGINMNAKEKAIAACDAALIARHIDDDAFKVGWFTDRLYETGVGSRVDDEGLFFWADTGYDDCDNPCWAWKNKPYSKGLMHAFHEELASVLSEGIPVQEINFPTPKSELQVISQLFGRVIINGQIVLNSLGDAEYVSVGNPHVAVGPDFVTRHGDFIVRLHNSVGGPYSKVLTGNLSEDMYDLLVGLFDIIDAPVLSTIAR